MKLAMVIAVTNVLSKELWDQGLSFDDFLNQIENDDNLSKYRVYSKRVLLSDDHIESIKAIAHNIKVVGIVAEWCFDSMINLPIFVQWVSHNPKIEYRLFIKDNHPEILPSCNGGQKIPYFKFYSPDFHYVLHWVERPMETYRLYAEMRKEFGWKIDKGEFAKEYRKNFLRKYKVLREATLSELIQVLLKVDAILSASKRVYEYEGII